MEFTSRLLKDMLKNLTEKTKNLDLDGKIRIFRDECDPDDVQQLKAIFNQAPAMSVGLARCFMFVYICSSTPCADVVLRVHPSVARLEL